jgi:hypothetical protein
MFLSLQTFSQTVLRNDGEMNVAGGFVNLQGSYLNATSGGITLDGTITLTGNWTNNTAGNIIESPGSNGEVIFAGTTLQTIGGSATSPFYFEKLTINTGAIVEVTPGKGVTTYGPSAFTSPLILRTTTGRQPQTATFINNSTVTGNISAELYYYSTGTAAKAGGRTWYLSPPTTNATAAIFNVAAGANQMAFFNTAANAYVRVTTNAATLNPMQGYELRSATSNTFTFTGPPNNGAFSKSGMAGPGGTDGFYLLGNPYPSVLDWNLTTRDNGLYTTLWYRTMTAANVMVYDTWNGTVGTSNNGTAAVDGKIPPLQAFWVCAIAGQTGSMSFDNTARTHNWGTAAFIKSARIKDYDAFRIAVYSNGVKDEQIIMQSENGKDSMDRWDAFKLFLNQPAIAEIFTLSAEKKRLVIQSVAPVTKEKLFPLGLKTGHSGNFKFVADISGSSEDYTYFLEDKQQNIMQDLGLNAEYNFTSDIVNDTTGSRFVIHVKKVLLPDIGTGNQTPEANPVLIYASGQQIMIRNCPLNAKILVYDVLGRAVYETSSETDYKVISTNLQNGYYMVKLINNNKIITRIVPISL